MPEGDLTVGKGAGCECLLMFALCVSILRQFAKFNVVDAPRIPRFVSTFPTH